MSTPVTPIDLSASDVDALRWAARFASGDASLPISAILLETRGRVVATDGHRLLIREIAALKGLDENLLVTPNGIDVLHATPAALEIKLDEIRLRLSDEELAWGIKSASFPNYESILPDNSTEKARLRFTIDVSTFHAALDALEPFLEACHRPITGYTYSPATLIELNTKAQTLRFTVNQSMGYTRPGGGVETSFEPVGLRWSHRIGIDVTDSVGYAENFRLYINAYYLRDAVNALGEHAELIVEFSGGPHKGVVVRPAEGGDRTMTMPMA